jgi:hypothetical protein
MEYLQLEVFVTFIAICFIGNAIEKRLIEIRNELRISNSDKTEQRDDWR